MRVLVIETTVFGYDGITNVLTNYFRYQNHERVQMDLVTINPVSQSFSEELYVNNSKHYVLECRNRNPLAYLIRLVHIIRKGKYQIVHVHGCSAIMAIEMLAALIAGVKVRIAHSHNTKCDHVIADRLLRPLFRQTCNTGFACGKEAGEWLFPNKPFRVISNGIDLDKFQFDNQVRDTMRTTYGLEDKFVIGHVGRFSEQKNHKKLLDIYKTLQERNPDSKLVLIGDGELKQEMEDQAVKEGLDVLFVGLTNEVDKWLQAVDMIVFPSLFEGLPLGLVEAQAAGLPCVLSDTISLGTKITDLVDFVGLNDTSDVWVDRIESMRYQYDRPERKEWVREQVENAHFDIRKNCRELADIYDSLLQ